MRFFPARGTGMACALAATFVVSGATFAQSSLTFPMTPRGADGIDQISNLPALEIDAEGVRALTQLDRVVLNDFALMDGSRVDLSLTRVNLDRLGFGFQVNGLEAPGLLDGLDLSVWLGDVVGDASSEVVLGFSNRGVRGWVTTDGEVTHLMPQPGFGNDWSDGYSVVAREIDLTERGLALSNFCAAEKLSPEALTSGVAPQPTPDSFSGGGSCNVLECKMAIETDFQLFQVFGDLGAETAFITTLLAASSARYEEQIDTVLTFPYLQFYTTASDPWNTPDIGGDSIDMLNEFVGAWAGNVPAGAVLGHMLSGANLGGGVAYLGVLCDTAQNNSFGVSGNLSGQTPFPIAVSPLNWDFMVFSHEVGHNFSSPHTHDYSPQIDDCANGTCITDGTIMSYCHLCPGGLSNITTYFNDPTVVNVMKAHANSCLPSLAPLVVSASAQPILLAPATPTQVTVDLQGVPVGTVDLNYRLSSGFPFSSVAMGSLGGGTFGANLPSANCGDMPEWFFSVVDQNCGFFQTATFTAEVGNETVFAFDDFETDLGWTVGGGSDDATTGIWSLGDPLATAAQPDNDITTLGTDCWFTGQGSPGGSLGENDVDGGQTTLTSTVIDLSAGDARVGYWRWYSNDAGSTPNSDIFEVEISNGSAWGNVETIGPAGAGTSGGWIYHDFLVSDFVTPNSTVQVRFIASDEGSGSIVEAAIDEFKVFNVTCGETCQANLGFGGPGTGVLSLCGGDLSTGTSADLLLSGATPSGTAFVFVGALNNPLPVKGGMLVPVPWLLNLALPLDGSGSLDLSVPGGGGPLTVYVQAVYTDGGQTNGYGFSNALEVQFLP
ncbi:MAG: hypothetical protein ACI9EF_002650 [Pseudohongiellaceae bacterium]|jgi:hypothetical protein